MIVVRLARVSKFFHHLNVGGLLPRMMSRLESDESFFQAIVRACVRIEQAKQNDLAGTTATVDSPPKVRCGSLVPVGATEQW